LKNKERIEKAKEKEIKINPFLSLLLFLLFERNLPKKSMRISKKKQNSCFFWI
jgi:hypothetical protein